MMSAPQSAVSARHQGLVVVEELERPNTEILSFACAIPDDMSFVPKDPDDLLVAAQPIPVNRSSDPNQGIVGTITLLGSKSAMIWFGWGEIRHEAASSHQRELGNSMTAGSASNLSMGPFMVAMPRSKYQGAFSAEAPSSKLIGATGDIQSEMIASQIAARLSQRLKMAVFVSCSLEDTPSLTGCEGIMERHMLRCRAGALVEREVGRLLEGRISQRS